jgi:hypothetical protein
MSVVLQHEIGVVVSPVGHNRWRGTHSETPGPKCTSSLRANDLPRQFTICRSRLSPIAQHSDRHIVPVEIRPHIGATLAAAGEARLEIGEPKLVRPSIRAERKRVAAVMQPFKGRPFSFLGF